MRERWDERGRPEGEAMEKMSVLKYRAVEVCVGTGGGGVCWYEGWRGVLVWRVEV